MSIVLGGMTISLDGFVNDRNGDVSRLYPDLAESGEIDGLQDLIQKTGAVVMGRRSYAMGDPDAYADSYEFQVPIFVLTHQVPDKLPRGNDKLTFTFVTDGIESAIAQAKAAAGDKDVTVIGGAQVIQQCLNAGLLDVLEIGLIPVLLGDGLRLFENLDTEHIRLERIEVIESAAWTDLRFRVVK